MKSEVKWLRKANVAARYGVDQSLSHAGRKAIRISQSPCKSVDGVTAWNLDELDEHDRKTHESV